MSHPRFSTIIPTYNRAALLDATLESVLGQRFSDQEVIVIDDGSTDDTPSMLAGYGERIHVLRQVNQGPGAARNLGIEHARGQYIALIDSDDLWLPWTLETYDRVIRENGEPAFIASRELPFKGDFDLSQVKETSLQWRGYADYYASHADAGWVPLCGVAVRGDVLRQVGGFPTTRINYEESDLWLRLGAAPGFVRIIEPLCSARRWHEDNITHDLSRTIEGVSHLIAREAAAEYPGGGPRKGERLDLLTRHIRPVSLECLKRGRRDAAWDLYRRSFLWHLKLAKLKYLLGFPVKAMLGGRSS